MKPKHFFLFLLILLVSCVSKQEDGTNIPARDSVLDKSTPTSTSTADADSDTEILETFVDSLRIGEKGKTKIELVKHRVMENSYVIVKFYTRGPAYWYLQNTYLYECNSPMDLDPNISDFDNDKFNDITFISASAARGANEVRRLFVYDDFKKELISIVNAQDYPNLQYNKDLDCIDAFLVHGGTTTVFARIVNDSLKTFASVDSDGDNRTVYEVDKSGKEKLLRRDTIINPEDVYLRYVNYKPLKAYGN